MIQRSIKGRMASLLKGARKAEGLTQERLAEKANMPRSVIARIEGTYPYPVPSLNLFSKLMGAMGYSTRLVSVKGRKKFQVTI